MQLQRVHGASSDDIGAGVEYLLDRGVAAINLSLGDARALGSGSLCNNSRFASLLNEHLEPRRGPGVRGRQLRGGSSAAAPTQRRECARRRCHRPDGAKTRPTQAA